MIKLFRVPEATLGKVLLTFGFMALVVLMDVGIIFRWPQSMRIYEFILQATDGGAVQWSKFAFVISLLPASAAFFITFSISRGVTANRYLMRLWLGIFIALGTELLNFQLLNVFGPL